jgi:DNA (cytosine-5)-methyltransferase 1
MLRVLDLFSGIGGFSLGLEQTGGFETVAFCEIDKEAGKVLKKHWPNVPIFTDVKTLNKEEVDKFGPIDVICGGFPCQDISCAGNREGIHAKRSGLWWKFQRLISDIRPKYVLVENVSALLIRGLDEVLGSLSEIGYDAEWEIIRASEFGLPHRRERIFLVAYPQSEHGPKTSLLQPGRGRDYGRGFRCEGEFRRLLSLENWTEEDTRRANGGRPIICRKNDGIPGKVHRLKQLGNSIVPACAQYVAQCVLEFDKHQ